MALEEATIVALLLVIIIGNLNGSASSASAGGLSRRSFTKGFVFGTASSSYQYEGAVKVGGRGETIWDTFAHTFGKVIDFSNADVAVDQYHRFEEDIKLMKDLSVDAYRFSIAWSRLFPNGTGAEVNRAGVDHYNRVINTLLANDYSIYAETCFKQFGDRVKHWITFNEPHTFAIQGYDVGLQDPGRCSILVHIFCRAGNSATEPYIVAHNVLLSHATAADIYRRKYKETQQGSLGISYDVIWFEPMSESQDDINATQRAQDFQFGWFMDPLFFGDYPSSMRTRVGNRLPKFSKAESVLLKGSLDFVGINHYYTFYAQKNSTDIVERLLNDTLADSGAVTLPFKGLTPIGDRAASIWLYIVPVGIRNLMKYIKKKYGNPQVFITENGMDDANDPLIPISDALKDEKRINYHNQYLGNLSASIKEDGCDVKGYFVWSLLDNWEWAAGYTSRFGLYFVDYGANLTRYPKDSVQWFKNMLNSP